MSDGPRRFKILALDGGSNRSLLQCMALETLYPGLSGREILARFDLVAANSGGSLVLAGLLKDQTPHEILATFDHPDGPKALFVKLPYVARLLHELTGIGPKYSTAKKRRRIAASLENLYDMPMAKLHELFKKQKRAPRIFIAAFDYDHERAVFFRSYDTPLQKASTVGLTDVINASTTAPVVLFDAPAHINGRRYWDGAIGGYNNPVMAAVIEALITAASLADLAILSLGTGSSVKVPLGHTVTDGPKDFFERTEHQCLKADIVKMARSIIADPPDAANYAATILLESLNTYKSLPPFVRLSPSIQPILDKATWTAPKGLTRYDLKVLLDLPPDLSTDDEVEMVKTLGAKWIAGDVPNQPIYMGPDLECWIGDGTFPNGGARWKALDP